MTIKIVESNSNQDYYGNMNSTNGREQAHTNLKRKEKTTILPIDKNRETSVEINQKHVEQDELNNCVT